MKRFTVLLFIIIASMQAFPQSFDSLTKQRERLYARYSELSQPGKELSKDDMQKMMELLKQVVIVDTKIINGLAASDNKVKKAEARLDAIRTENSNLNGELSDSGDRIMILYIISGALLCMLVIAVVMLVVVRGRYANMKKNAIDLPEMMKMAENDRQVIQDLSESLRAKDKEISAKKTAISDLQKEKEELESKLNDVETKLEELQKQPPPTVPTASEPSDPNLAKLEKLAKMKELGIVTEEEYNTFKRKFLGDL